MSEKTINDVTRPMIDISYVDDVLDTIKYLINDNTKCDDVNIGIRIGLLQAYTVLSDVMIVALVEKIK